MDEAADLADGGSGVSAQLLEQGVGRPQVLREAAARCVQPERDTGERGTEAVMEITAQALSLLLRSGAQDSRDRCRSAVSRTV